MSGSHKPGLISLFALLIFAQGCIDRSLSKNSETSQSSLNSDVMVTGLSSSSSPVKSVTWSFGCNKSSCTYRSLVSRVTTADLSSLPFGSTTSASQLSGDGIYYLHVQAKDAAGNTSSVTTVSAILDNTAPTVTFTKAAGQASSASYHPIEFSIAFSEAINTSTFTTSIITNSGTASVSAWSITNSGNNQNFTLSATSSGSGTIKPVINSLQVSDIAGNLSLGGTSSDTITYTAPPPKVSAGSLHTCGVTGAGVLNCWGINNDGQLGDGTTTERNSPVVIDSGTSYSQISLGGYHTCGITTAGVLKCWGNNSYGQLGDGTTTQRNSPVVIDSGTSYSQTSTGATHNCGITTAGDLKCWGCNDYGQLGDGATTQRNSPTVINLN